jgi:type IV secretion system protein TrbE
MLQELMMLDPMGAERDQIMEIATLILPWCRDGNYGCLFDGTSNLSLTGKIAHFELGYPERFAQEALGHNSKAVHRSYSRKAKVRLPSLESYEKQNMDGRIIPLPNRETNGHSISASG